MSHNLTVPLLLLYTKRLHSDGWNSAAVITSVNSSMLAGLMSTISETGEGGKQQQDNCAVQTIIARFQPNYWQNYQIIVVETF